jgi:hypothetical protein
MEKDKIKTKSIVIGNSNEGKLIFLFRKFR